MRPRLTQQVQGRDDERGLRLTTCQTPPSMRPARHGASPPCATSLYCPCCCCCCRTCPKPRQTKPTRNPLPLPRFRRPPPGLPTSKPCTPQASDCRAWQDGPSRQSTGGKST